MYRKNTEICVWGISMKHHLNVKIIDAINESEYEKPIKEFLISALIVEFRKIDQAKPRVKKDYEQLTNRGTAAMGGEK